MGSVIAAEWGTGEVFWSMLWFFLFFIWIWMLVMVFSHIFRSHDLSGWGKAAWSIFIIVLPYLGVFVYLIARGNRMGADAVADRQASEAAFQQYVRQTAGSDEHGRRARTPQGAARPGSSQRRRVRPGQGQGARLTQSPSPPAIRCL